jgi:hypothetical protein
MERFEYPVWLLEADRCSVRLDEPAYVLFDYQKRDALSYDARVCVIENVR